MRVEAGRVVIFEYLLHAEDGELLDASGGTPRAYLHGADNILDGLERALDGCAAGEERSGVLEPADAFGAAPEGPPDRVSRFAFPRDAELAPGQHFLVDRDGDQVDYYVVEVDGDTVHARADHPLAGRRVRYWARVVEVRDATETERAHGHPL